MQILFKEKRQNKKLLLHYAWFLQHFYRKCKLCLFSSTGDKKKNCLMKYDKMFQLFFCSTYYKNKDIAKKTLTLNHFHNLLLNFKILNIYWINNTLLDIYLYLFYLLYFS